MNAHVILGEDGPLANRLQQAGVSVEVLPIDAATRELRRDAVRFGGATRGRRAGGTQMGGAALAVRTPRGSPCACASCDPTSCTRTR